MNRPTRKPVDPCKPTSAVRTHLRHYPLRGLLALAIGVAGLGLTADAVAQDVTVTDTAGLLAALASPDPGSTITLAPGTYDIDRNISCTSPGTAELPIRVRAEQLGDAVIRFDALEGFKVLAPNWHFENLDIVGVCANDSDCEHAFHIVGAADNTVLRGNRVRNFNAQVKGNGTPGEGGLYRWPDDVLIEGNEFYNDAPRNTSNPVTPIDIVGGRRWIVRANFIHDFAKAEGNQVSYAAFFKGNSRDGVFERNLVACSWLHSGQTRVGLSLGGGGTSPDSICEDGRCTPEHQNGTIRNNIILNCSDVGIYLNQAANTAIVHNTILFTSGIDVRFADSSATIEGNLVMGAIRTRDGGSLTDNGNLIVSDGVASGMFADPAAGDFTPVNIAEIQNLAPMLGVDHDYLLNPRDDGAPDIGALEFGGFGSWNTVPPPLAAGPIDPGDSDTGPSDTGDTGPTDTGPTDTGPTDTGSSDTGSTDTGSSDTGTTDTGTDAAITDASTDTNDVQSSDGGIETDPTEPDTSTADTDPTANDTDTDDRTARDRGCATTTRPGTAAGWLVLLGVVFRRRRIEAKPRGRGVTRLSNRQ